MPKHDEIPIAVRAYVPVDRAPAYDGPRKPKLGPSEYTLIFDTETNTDAAQQLRFGWFQVRKGDALVMAGIFYDPNSLTPSDIEVLKNYAQARGRTLGTVTEFIDEVFFPYAYDLQSQVCPRIHRETRRDWRG